VQIIEIFSDGYYLQRVTRICGQFYRLRNQYCGLCHESWDRSEIDAALILQRQASERHQFERKLLEEARARLGEPKQNGSSEPPRDWVKGFKFW
jgi:hypothetical protein